MKAPAEIHVCVLCGNGAKLALALEPAIAEMGCSLRRIDCLGGCARHAMASFANAGRWGWMFGNLTPADAPDLIALCRLWLQSPDGLVAKTLRPPRLGDRILGHMPPCTQIPVHKGEIT